MMMMIVQLFFILLIQYVYMINIIQVRVSTESPNSWIVHDDKEGFIVGCGCYWKHGLVLGQTWREKFPDGKLPSFIFLTQTHPENVLGLVSLLNELNITRLPVYVSDPSALAEMNHLLQLWHRMNPFEESTLLDIRQSPDQFSYDKHIKVLDRPLTIFNNEKLHIISNFPIADSVYASMLYLPSAKALFTGDLVAIRSHLFVPSFTSNETSDYYLCNWIGVLQSLKCAFSESTQIYPSYGDEPSTMSFIDAIETNIRWLTYMRAFVYDSCNTTFVMQLLENVFHNYSNIERSGAAIATRIPVSALSVGCKCSHNSTNTCGGLQPPLCQFIPKNKTQSLKSTAMPIGCVHQQLYSSSVQIEHSIVFIMLLANIF